MWLQSHISPWHHSSRISLWGLCPCGRFLPGYPGFSIHPLKSRQRLPSLNSCTLHTCRLNTMWKLPRLMACTLWSSDWSCNWVNLCYTWSWSSGQDAGSHVPRLPKAAGPGPDPRNYSLLLGLRAFDGVLPFRFLKYLQFLFPIVLATNTCWFFCFVLFCF